MYELQYTKPSNTTSAVAEFDKSQEGKYIAGGMTLIPTSSVFIFSNDCLPMKSTSFLLLIVNDSPA